MRLKRYLLLLLQELRNMRLAHKLMLVYSVIMAVTVMIFAGQLIGAANESTEQDLINDTTNLLKETKYSIQQEMDTCYRAENSIASDYETISYIKSWDKSDKTNIFEFRMDLTKKFERIITMSPDIYQLRIFTINPNFPEIGSIIYSDSRLINNGDIFREATENPGGYWELNHLEENYNPSIVKRKIVVSLYTKLRYANIKNLGIAEVTIPSDIFFRHIYAQSGNQNLIPFIMDRKGNIIYDKQSVFARKYHMSSSNFSKLVEGIDLKGSKGRVHITYAGVSMNLIYDYIDKLDCSVCYVVTNGSIAKSLSKTRLLIVGECLVALLILCILIYFFTFILLNKMKQIIASMRKVESGRLDIRVDVSSKDEMSELAYHFNRMLEKISGLIDEVVNKTEAKKNAEIRALFSQINSHFIINTLENISMMAEVECQYEVADAITSLGKLLRYSMKWSKEYVRLGEEIEYLENYVILMNLRYDYEIRLNVQISQEFLNYQILKMLLQPIVENSIHYGLKPDGHGGEITLCCFSEEAVTIIEITDNGVGMEEDRLAEVRKSIDLNIPLDNTDKRGNGIGLRNVNERIRLFYGDGYGIEINSVKGHFTRVTVKLPSSELNGRLLSNLDKN
ncbi:MAG TPA: sensor histidine kinase [Ruminiclostridium sp.]|nr:sensor histidine kinase [Ruminiclostridium sp.]